MASVVSLPASIFVKHPAGNGTGPVFVEQARPRRRDRACLGRRSMEKFLELPTLLGMDQLEEIAAGPILQREAEHFLNRRRRIDNIAYGVYFQDHIGDILD